MFWDMSRMFGCLHPFVPKVRNRLPFSPDARVQNEIELSFFFLSSHRDTTEIQDFWDRFFNAVGGW
jgi:hypothetical protein